MNVESFSCIHTCNIFVQAVARTVACHIATYNVTFFC